MAKLKVYKLLFEVGRDLRMCSGEEAVYKDGTTYLPVGDFIEVRKTYIGLRQLPVIKPLEWFRRRVWTIKLVEMLDGGILGPTTLVLKKRFRVKII